MRTKPTVFVVDADAQSRGAVSDLVSQMSVRCMEYDSGQEFLDSYDPSQPGCLVVEVRIPDVGGLQIQDRLAQEGATTPVIFLTAHADAPTAVRAMRSGALQFLEKPFRDHELWEAVQEAMALDQELRQERQVLKQQRELIGRLTPKERQVLLRIIDGKPNRVICQEMDVCLRTVELRRASLMNKLQVESFTELLRLVGPTFYEQSRASGRNAQKYADGTYAPRGWPSLEMPPPRGNHNGRKRPR